MRFTFQICWAIPLCCPHNKVVFEISPAINYILNSIFTYNIFVTEMPLAFIKISWNVYKFLKLYINVPVLLYRRHWAKFLEIRKFLEKRHLYCYKIAWLWSRFYMILPCIITMLLYSKFTFKWNMTFCIIATSKVVIKH